MTTFGDGLPDGSMVHFYGFVNGTVHSPILYIAFKDRPIQPTAILNVNLNKNNIQIIYSSNNKTSFEDLKNQGWLLAVDWDNVKKFHFALRFASGSIITYFNFKNVSIGVYDRNELPRYRILKVEQQGTVLETVRVGGGSYTLPWKEQFSSGKLEYRQNLTLFVKPTNTSGYSIALRNEQGLYGFLLKPNYRGDIIVYYNPTKSAILSTAEQSLTKDVEAEITFRLQGPVRGQRYLSIFFDRKMQFIRSVPLEEEFVQIEIDGLIEIYDVTLGCDRPPNTPKYQTTEKPNNEC